MNQLLLASKSRTRKQLLEEIGINVKGIPHSFNETASCGWTMPLVQLAESIAIAKMNSVNNDVLDTVNDVVFILTADTLCQDKNGSLYGKPQNKEDAIAMIKVLREGGRVATAFRLEKRIRQKENWKIIEQITEVVTTSFILDIPDDWIDRYLEQVPDWMDIGGALDVQGYGGQFLQSVEGSYTALLGLPLYEIRIALEKLGFYSE